jgi:hypothetical protein
MKGPAFFLCPTRIDADVTLYFLLQIAVAFFQKFHRNPVGDQIYGMDAP